MRWRHSRYTVVQCVRETEMRWQRDWYSMYPYSRYYFQSTLYAGTGTVVISNSTADITAGNVTLTLPTAASSNGQFLKTDGSTNLGFRTLDNAFQSADKSSVTYTMPNADGTANQLLQTDSSTGTKKAATLFCVGVLLFGS